MIRRRKLLGGFGTIAGAVTLAGCSGSDESEGSDEPESESESEGTEGSESEPESEGTEESESEPDDQQRPPVDSLPDITVDNINLTFGSFSGLRARIELSNDIEGNTQNVYTEIEALDGDRSLESSSTWSQFKFSTEVDLKLENIGSLSDHELDDISEFVIRGRVEETELGDIERLSGDELRDRVDADQQTDSS